MFDYTKQSKTLLVDLINEDNTTGLTPSLVEFGVPSVLIGDRNTSITLTGATGSGYKDAVDLTYNRVDVNGFVGTVDLTFQAGEALTIAELVPEVNSLLNINLGEQDFVDVVIPSFGNTPNETQPVTLTIAPNSLVYIGQLTILVSNGELDLADLITTTELNGFFIDPSQMVNGPLPDVPAEPLVDTSTAVQTAGGRREVVVDLIEEDTTIGTLKFQWLATSEYDPQGWNLYFDLRFTTDNAATAFSNQLASIQLGGIVIDETSLDWEGIGIIESIRTWGSMTEEGIEVIAGMLEIEPTNQTAPLMPAELPGDSMQVVVMGTAV